MAKSSLTEKLTAHSPPTAHGPHSRPSAPAPSRSEQKSQPIAISTSQRSEISKEIMAIFSQGSNSFTRKGTTSFFGCSPPNRSDNGMVRDAVFGRCIPFSNKQPGTPSSPASAFSIS